MDRLDGAFDLRSYSEFDAECDFDFAIYLSRAVNGAKAAPSEVAGPRPSEAW